MEGTKELINTDAIRSKVYILRWTASNVGSGFGINLWLSS